jgi:hypothetical protein
VNVLFLASLLAMAPDGDEIRADDGVDPDKEYGPFFEEDAPSDTKFNTESRKKRTPALSVGNGAFCFVEGTYCKASMILSASVAAGMRIPASDKGPDLPFAQFTFRGGVAIRPLMLARREWHPWGLGVVASWSRGTGSVTVDGTQEDQQVDSTERTEAFRVGGMNQLWLSRKKYGLHLDFTLGAVQADVLTSGVRLWGTAAEVAMGWGGWGGMYLAGDFLDDDTRVVFGFRGHGFAAGPIIAMALAGLAIGGEL